MAADRARIHYHRLEVNPGGRPINKKIYDILPMSVARTDRCALPEAFDDRRSIESMSAWRINLLDQCNPRLNERLAGEA